MKELNTMLEIKNLTKTLGDKLILKNVTMSLDEGELIAIIGPNGAGKTTFFKCLVGLLKPTGGELFLDGKAVKVGTLKKKIGFLGHESFLYNTMTPLENLRFYGKLYEVKDLEDKIYALLKEIGLYFFKDTSIRSFSRGMIQRLAIAKVLLPDPTILLLDEPHTGLDLEAVSLLNKILIEKKKAGKSILLISHDYEQVQSLTDRVALLNKGKIEDMIELKNSSDFILVKQWYEEVVSKR